MIVKDRATSKSLSATTPSKIGVSSEYQQTEEYKQNESFDNYHKFISNFIEENNIQTL